MDFDIGRSHPLFEGTSKGDLECGTDWRKQQAEADNIGQDARGDEQ